VRESIVARLRALDADDPGFPEQATETFVEGVLLAEFGQQMTNDPQFRQVIRNVAREMRTEPATASDLDELFRSMQSG
jgi:hypothetical protein